MYKVLLEMGQRNSEMQRTLSKHGAVSNGSGVSGVSKERVWDEVILELINDIDPTIGWA